MHDLSTDILSLSGEAALLIRRNLVYFANSAAFAAFIVIMMKVADLSSVVIKMSACKSIINLSFAGNV